MRPHVTPIVLTPTGTSDDFGGFGLGQDDPDWSVTVPASVPTGDYSLVVTGSDSGVVGSTPFSVLAPAASLTGPYALYCPGTPVGNVGLNNVATSATIADASGNPLKTLTNGQSFELTGYQ